MSRAHERAKVIVAEAVTLHERFRGRLLRDAELLKLLAEYRTAIENTFNLMRNLKIADKCAQCGQSEKGSCCAPEVATWYDPETLLINLLFDLSLPSVPYYPDHCLFLGQNGCTLMARHYYCVHFLCPALKKGLSEEALRSLMTAVGREILAGSNVLTHLRRKTIPT